MEGGFTLLEMLAALALTAMVSTVVASLLFTTLATRRNIQQRTDGHESLRIVATMIIEDTRFAVRPVCDWNSLKLYTNATLTNYIMYQFAWSDGTEDPHRLHRWEVEGGDVIRDDIVGWNLVPPDPMGEIDGTGFICDVYTTTKKAAGAHLVQAPPQGQTAGTALDVVALLR